jgi:hypothetical protein
MDLRDLDQRLCAAVAAGDEDALMSIADEIEAAGLPATADLCRTQKTTGLRALLAGVLGTPS